jgi:hypothetical protein
MSQIKTEVEPEISAERGCCYGSDSLGSNHEFLEQPSEVKASHRFPVDHIPHSNC